MMAWALFCHDFDLSKGINILSEKCPVVLDHYKYYSLGREDLTTFRLNPFELVSKYQNLSGHISMLKATITAVFPMEASMPSIVEGAIIKAYEEKGWDIALGSNYFVDDPWDTSEKVWPTFSDMIAQLDIVIAAAKMGKEFEEKYRGSLVSRLSALTDGVKGIMINTNHSINFDKLLDEKVVIELEELRDEEDKAFFMALIIGRLAECIKYRHRQQPTFRHMTLIEEAHRLLARPEPGSDGSKAMGVEMFANLLAEVRKYGESLIIADQIPNKLVADVIKNTNTKIVHRLFAADDRNTIGDAIGLNDDQKDFLPLLQPGETIIYSGGWHAPVRAQIDQLADTNAKEINEEQIARMGREQLYTQRETLFPRLSACAILVNQKDFVTFVHAGRGIINILIKLCQAQVKNSPLNIHESKLVQRLHEKVQSSCKHLNISASELAILLQALCLDCLVPMWPMEDEEILQNSLLAVIGAIDASPEEFDFFKTEKIGLINCFTSEKAGLGTYTSI